MSDISESHFEGLGDVDIVKRTDATRFRSSGKREEYKLIAFLEKMIEETVKIAICIELLCN